MYIIHNSHLQIQALQKLETFGTCLAFDASGLIDFPLSGHPDMFMCQTPTHLIVAPNTPASFIKLLQTKQIPFIIGSKPVEAQQFSPYNAVVTDKWIIHRQSATDESIFNLNQNHHFIDVKQGYTRCSLLAILNHLYITSDQDIYRKLLSLNVTVKYVCGENIMLPGYRNGCFGGCFGIYQDTLFCMGNLDYLPEGYEIRLLLEKHQIKIIELCDTPLYDYGSLFIIP